MDSGAAERQAQGLAVACPEGLHAGWLIDMKKPPGGDFRGALTQPGETADVVDKRKRGRLPQTDIASVGSLDAAM